MIFLTGRNRTFASGAYTTTSDNAPCVNSRGETRERGESSTQVAGKTKGARGSGRSSPVGACTGGPRGRCRVAVGYVGMSSPVAAWLVAGPGFLEAELEIGRLGQSRWREGRRAGAQDQALENAADHLGLVDGCQDPHASSAAIALEGVHGEHTAEKLRPWKPSLAGRGGNGRGAVRAEPPLSRRSFPKQGMPGYAGADWLPRP